MVSWGEIFRIKCFDGITYKVSRKGESSEGNILILREDFSADVDIKSVIPIPLLM